MKKATLKEAGVKFTRFTNCLSEKDKTVSVSAVNRSISGDNVCMRYTMDLSGLSGEEILENAAANLNIRWLRKRLFEGMDTDTLMGVHGSIIDVGEERPSRIIGDPVKKAEKALAGLSSEQVENLLKKVKG